MFRLRGRPRMRAWYSPIRSRLCILAWLWIVRKIFGAFRFLRRIGRSELAISRAGRYLRLQRAGSAIGKKQLQRKKQQPQTAEGGLFSLGHGSLGWRKH